VRTTAGRPTNATLLLVRTPDQRNRIKAARLAGGTCCGCARPLLADEPVYLERFRLLWLRNIPLLAPVGLECASAEMLGATTRVNPEPCAGCGRGVVYYWPGPRPRTQALCSEGCRNQTDAAKQGQRESKRRTGGQRASAT
jgi:hypothetical protein